MKLTENATVGCMDDACSPYTPKFILSRPERLHDNSDFSYPPINRLSKI